MVLDSFKEWIGYPAAAAGVLLGGGSAATTALACARESLIGPMVADVVAYCSDQAHSSVARAARALGFRPEQVRVLPTDEHFRMRPDALAATMEADVAAGRRPLFVAAAAGSTNTGAIDPMPELAAIARAHGAWLHVDGAYGAFAALTERGHEALAGIGLADSVTLDPHKWLYQPFECGCLLVREGRLLDEAFLITPDYLKDIEVARQEVNFSDRSFQLTRVSRALKPGRSRCATSGWMPFGRRSTGRSTSPCWRSGASRRARLWSSCFGIFSRSGSRAFAAGSRASRTRTSWHGSTRSSSRASPTRGRA